MGGRVRNLALWVALATAVGALAAAALGDEPVATSAAGKAEFVADCPFSHRGNIDPIVYPGRRQAGHTHDFFGSRITRGTTTNRQLRRSPRTTCTPRSDRSAYWVPTVFEKGRALKPEQVTIYYTVDPRLADDVQPFPRDLRIVAGNAKEDNAAQGAPNVWSCLGSDVDGDPGGVMCPSASALELILNFPDCWDGRRVDSRDHASHMAYSQAGACPASHPVAVPQVQFKIRWPSLGGPGVALASGNAYSAHGDFMNGWRSDALQRRIDDCLKTVTKCDVRGQPTG